jgi:putative ABC transport system ATP-binding protein
MQTGVTVLDAIQRINLELGTTTAVITHNAVISDMADRVVTLSDGLIADSNRNDHRVYAKELAW